MSRDPPQRREARFAKRRCALQPDSLTVGVRKAQATARQGRRDRNGRSKPAVDLRHQTLAIWPETRRGSAETGRCAAAALAEWGST
ncbi:hypothetical protein EN46_27255, partial [Citrobacter amalonaticus]